MFAGWGPWARSCHWHPTEGATEKELSMLSERELSAAIGSTAYDGSGHKIGTVEHFFVDDRTGAPTWVAVATGLFGTRTTRPSLTAHSGCR